MIASQSINAPSIDRSIELRALPAVGLNRGSSTMWRTGGRGSILWQLLRRAVAATAPHDAAARFRVVDAAGFDHGLGSPWAYGQENVSWLQQRAGISIAGDGADSHDDFKPLQKGGSSVPSVQEHIEKDIKENAVLVYMKGVPEAPQCGFSAMVVRILDEYGVQYKSRDVLTDPELRNAIKEYRCTVLYEVVT